MFSVQCPGHGRAVLMTAANITSIVNRPDGIEVHWRCRCGAVGSWLTGAQREARVPVPA